MNKYVAFIGYFLTVSGLLAQSHIEIKLQNAIDSIYKTNPASIGIMLHVESPENEISWSGASGFSSKDQKLKLQPDQPILIASSIKTYVAATILKLVAQEKLNIDQPIATLISDKTKNLLINDGYDLSSIKVKHLLSHTSGIWNYANQEYIDHKKKHPNYRWTRDEQLQLMVDKGDPIGDPGSQFSYADANYLLLTEIIETLTGQPFYTAMRSLLSYKDLSINDTWFPTLEKKPVGTKALAHQYWGDYDWDSYNLDISWDLYGGGGLASTTKDMATFLYHYFNGNIIANDSIKDLIFTEIRTKETELNPYYLGLSQNNFHGMNAFGHGGFWSTAMLYFPSINTAVSVCILERDKRSLRRTVNEVVSKILLDDYKKHQNQNKKIHQYLNNLTDFSGTILVAHKDEIIENRAYGLSNNEAEIKNTLDTKFNIASISKLFTSIAVLQLIEQEKMSATESVGQFLPNYPNVTIRDSVTVHQLLTHTSGIPPFYGKKYLQTDKIRYKEVKDFVPLFEKDTLSFHPGTQYQYSGSGFVLIGQIIEKISGMDYYRYIDNFIFKKAGMQLTLAIPTDSIVLNKANGYTTLWGEQAYFSRNDYYISKASPAGGHYTTAEDLFYFSKAMRNGVLINKESYKNLITPKVKGYNTHLGYGIDIDQRYDEQIIGHSGGWFGVRTELMDFMASEYTVIILSNNDDDGNSGASKVIDDFKKIIAGNKR